MQGFTQGFAILAAQEFGAGAYDRLRRVLAMIIKLSCWFGIAVTIISLLLVRPLLAIIAASFVNIALDLLFVMGVGWGIFGASFATVLAQLIAFLLCLRSLRRLPFVQLAKADWKTDPAILLHLCRLGIPTGCR